MSFRALVLEQTDERTMILGGVGRRVRSFPHVPGVDLAGTVVASESDGFAPATAWCAPASSSVNGSPRARRWRSAPPASPPCSASTRSSAILGVDSVSVPTDRRAPQWQRLGDLCDPSFFGAATSVIGLEELPAAGAKIQAGQVRGPILVDTSR